MYMCFGVDDEVKAKKQKERQGTTNRKKVNKHDKQKK